MKLLEGVIIGYRRGPRSQYNRQVLIKVKEKHPLGSLCGAKVWVIDKYGNKYWGKITRLHSKRGVYRALFYKPIPGQLINSTVHIAK